MKLPKELDNKYPKGNLDTSKERIKIGGAVVLSIICVLISIIISFTMLDYIIIVIIAWILTILQIALHTIPASRI